MNLELLWNENRTNYNRNIANNNGGKVDPDAPSCYITLDKELATFFGTVELPIAFLSGCSVHFTVSFRVLFATACKSETGPLLVPAYKKLIYQVYQQFAPNDTPRARNKKYNRFSQQYLDNNQYEADLLTFAYYGLGQTRNSSPDMNGIRIPSQYFPNLLLVCELIESHKIKTVAELDNELAPPFLSQSNVWKKTLLKNAKRVLDKEVVPMLEFNKVVIPEGQIVNQNLLLNFRNITPDNAHDRSTESVELMGDDTQTHNHTSSLFDDPNGVEESMNIEKQPSSLFDEEICGASLNDIEESNSYIQASKDPDIHSNHRWKLPLQYSGNFEELLDKNEYQEPLQVQYHNQKRTRRSSEIEQQITACKLSCRRSNVHSFGLFANSSIQEDKAVIEYTGEKISNDTLETRDKEYKGKGMKSSYFFRIDDHSVINATTFGNFARFINHWYSII